MKKKIFTLMTLALLSIGSAWADEVTVGRTYDFSASTLASSYTIVTVTNATTTQSDGTGVKTGTGKSVSLNSTAKSVPAPAYRSLQSNGSDALLSYQESSYLGFQTVIEDGYRLTVSNISAQVAVNNQFKYKVVVVDNGDNIVYESADKTGATNSTNNPSITPSGLVLSGTVQVRMYYYNSSGTDKSKYLVPLNFTITGELETASSFTVSTAVDGDGSVIGGGSYVDGTKATLKATPGAATFDHWTKASDVSWSSTDNPLQVAVTANETYTAHFAAATTHTITSEVAAGQNSYGSITNEGDNVIVEDETVTFEATANEGYAFVNWTTGGSEYSTDASITVTSTADVTYTANFKKLFTVTYSISDYILTTNKALNNYKAGSFDEIYADANDKYTIPAYSHYYLYKEGHRFSKWEDQDGNQYEKGTEITLTKDITLTPVWVATTQTLANSSAEVTVTWNLRYSTVLFNAWQGVAGAGAEGYYTKPQAINGETIAIPMTINANSGKIDNSGRADKDNAQVNAGTKFTIPAVKGMTVAIANGNTAFTTTTIAGSTDYTGTGTTSISYTYTGEESTIDIEINEGNQYLKTIAVTYPAMTIAKEITSAGYATFVPEAKVSVPSGVKAYIVTATDATTATLSADDAITVIPANTPVVIKGDAGTYYFPKTTADPSDVTGNKLNTGAVTANGTQYILADGTSGVGFYKATPDTEIAAGVAYLVSPSGSAPYFIFGIEGGTTGIDSVQGSEFTVNGEYYNLAGQRVAQPTKGLYIVNGKKVVVK